MKKGVLLLAIFAIVASITAASAADISGAIGLNSEYEQKYNDDGDKMWGDYSPYLHGWFAPKDSAISYNFMLLKTYQTSTDMAGWGDYLDYERSRIQVGLNYGGIKAGPATFGIGYQLRNQFQSWGNNHQETAKGYLTKHENIWAHRFIVSFGLPINDMISLGSWNLLSIERRKQVLDGSTEVYNDYDLELGLSTNFKLAPTMNAGIHLGYIDELDEDKERVWGPMVQASFGMSFGGVSLSPQVRYEMYKFGDGVDTEHSFDLTRIRAGLALNIPIVETVNFGGLIYHRWETWSPKAGGDDVKQTFHYFDLGISKSF